MNQGTPHIVLAGGGTAGHVNPLLAVAGAIRDIEPTAQVTVIGTAVGLEKDLVPEAGYELDTIEKVPFPRRPNLYMLRFPAKWKRETAKVRSILETRHGCRARIRRVCFRPRLRHRTQDGHSDCHP